RLSPCLTLSPSSTYAKQPRSRSRFSTRDAMVLFPDPERPVSQSVAPRWPWTRALSSRVTSPWCQTMFSPCRFSFTFRSPSTSIPPGVIHRRRSGLLASILCGICGVPLVGLGNMRVKTSITLPEELLRSLDRAAEGRTNRSRLIEQAVRELLEAQRRAARDARDIAIINRNARRLNAEAMDVLDYVK